MRDLLRGLTRAERKKIKHMITTVAHEYKHTDRSIRETAAKAGRDKDTIKRTHVKESRSGCPEPDLVSGARMHLLKQKHTHTHSAKKHTVNPTPKQFYSTLRRGNMATRRV